jgi:adenylate cyclase
VPDPSPDRQHELLRYEMQAEPESGSDQRLKRALLAHVRQDFSAPTGAIVGFAEILLEDAPRLGLGRFLPDLGRIREAGLALQRLVDGLLDSDRGAQGAADADYEAFCSRLRHDLRTPMNAIKGYGEMLLEEASAAESKDFVSDLQKLLAAAKRLLVRIDWLVDFARADPEQGMAEPAVLTDPLSAVLRPVPEPVTSVGRIDPSRILVVDDHESNRDLLARRLARDGHEVVTAENGLEALAFVENRHFDLVLLDLLMPGMSGYEALCRLKSDPRHCEIPVVMISALDEISSVVRCIEVGAEDYMPKPCDPVLLRARINSCLERKRLRDRERVFTEQLRIEKEKSEVLLLNVLPKPIVLRLQLGESVIADHIADATILFADLVGFTGLSMRLPAVRLVNLLNQLFTGFDRLAMQHGLEKIKTIGDCYMVAGGLLEVGRDHAARVADMALAILESVHRESLQLEEPLQIRIGMHSGPVVAGVIGTHKFIYDIWGDTVNIASRMESHGTADSINVSAEVHRRLRNDFIFESGGMVDLKGKGLSELYFLRGRQTAGSPR